METKFVNFKKLNLSELQELELNWLGNSSGSKAQLNALFLEISKRKAEIYLDRKKTLNILDLTQEKLSQREAAAIIGFAKMRTYKSSHKRLEILVDGFTEARTKMMNQLGFMICATKKNRYEAIL